ncbi:MAG: DNA polymerase III subunit gamma/tau [Gammaproteobacteria bacterium]|nr:DNA polymerase III subunit gamma/tau [Gammaproteobacteria bacterium]MDH5735495.1 DNA polymerase III subunit gamma/tau [Gammaproteobacteria bacterium]
MSYQVLARKWRPSKFTEMVGQEHVLRALTNALDEQRLHHAYLFTGTRGVGKTTVARIFAKALNCETGVTSTPCGQCSACKAIAEGRFIDLIEVDAASRTKVEDTRELLDNVQYAPSQGRFKVYLIDEVHMLSGHSFNALLKTLEEPPPHVKFLLATTDPQKLPVTVLSRCLQFNLKRMPMSLIEEHLQYILQQENVAFEQTALRLLANGADGSMRDALSLLDQAIAYGGGKLATEEVRAMLGTVSRDRIMSILRGLVAGDAQAVMSEVAALSEMTPDFPAALADLLALLHQMALAQHVPDAVDENLVEREDIKILATQISSEDVQLFYQVGLMGRKDLPLAPDERTGFEMALLRMLAFKPVTSNQLSRQGTVSAQVSTPVSPPVSQTVVSRESAQQPPRSQPKPSFAGDWQGLINAAGIKGMVKQLALNCTLQNYTGSEMNLLLSDEHGQLLNTNSQTRLQEALSEYLRDKIKLTISLGQGESETPAQAEVRKAAEKQQAAEQAIDQDPVVQALRDNFGAQVMPNSVKPNV